MDISSEAVCWSMRACNICGMTDDGRNKQRKHDTLP